MCPFDNRLKSATELFAGGRFAEAAAMAGELWSDGDCPPEVAALHGELALLRNRLGESRVHVCTIKPGYVDTVMTQGMKTFWLIGADQAAATILSAARRGVNQRFVPWRWSLVALALLMIPSFLFRRLNI